MLRNQWGKYVRSPHRLGLGLLEISTDGWHSRHPPLPIAAPQMLVLWGQGTPRNSMRRVGSLQVCGGGIGASIPLVPAEIICWPQAIG